MTENLTIQGCICTTDKLTFGHLREMKVGESKAFAFPADYSTQKARNVANTYRNYYKGTAFSINEQKDGTVIVTRKA